MSIEQPDKETILLWPAGAPDALGTQPEDQPSLTLYPPDLAIATGAVMVVLPGGGYGGHAEHESRPVADWLNAHGIFAAVLKYRLGPKYHHPVMLHDAQRAIRVVRANSAAWKIDPARVGILGFSAGGHLASTASVHYDAGDKAAADPIDTLGSRPDVSVLVYAVIDLETKNSHAGSMNNLLGDNRDPALLAHLTTHKQITPDTPPTFLVTAVDDAAVPVDNSLLYARALSAAGVQYELHAYQDGGHGFGMGIGHPILGRWPDDAAAWLKLHGF
ncbi:MAG TPA: alpha/beta hydrolase [Capsulimonadaceae bacterium]|jgi:acetyl esterase/lipase